jgi:hypothetical protein
MNKIVLLFIFTFAVQLSGAEWKQIVSLNGQNVCIVQIHEGTEITASGSGFLISRDGELLTNAHVVKSAYYSKDDKITVSFLYNKGTRRNYKAEIRSISFDIDVCVLKIDGRFDSCCQFGNSDKIGVMDEVAVMGYPLGQEFKSTPGYVQSIQNINEMGKMIDISASVDPGNSGGPLFDKKGNVVGIVTGKYLGYNFNFAMPINTAINFIKNYKNASSAQITTDPDGARIYVNGLYKGISPIRFDFYTNEATITAEKDGYVTEEKKTQLKRNVETKVVFNLKKRDANQYKIVIKTNPPGAEVTVENDEKGKTPIEFDLEQSGTVRIRIKKFGYKEVFTEVQLKDKKIIELEYTLE